jgi:hypothetical protein
MVAGACAGELAWRVAVTVYRLSRCFIHASIVLGSQPLTRPIVASGSGRRPGIWLYALTVLRVSPVRSATSVTLRNRCMRLRILHERMCT